jgi:hypothetical protein
MPQTSDSAKNKKWLKLAIVPALLAVLGFVLWSNQTSTPSESSAPAIVTVAPPTVLVKSTPKSAAPAQPKRVAWPKFSHKEILATNPFRGSSAMRAALRPQEESPAAAASNVKGESSDLGSEDEVDFDPWAQLVENFQGKSKGVYIESSKGPAMKIGARLWQVGDQIGERYRITEIRPDGIVVETAPALK